MQSFPIIPVDEAGRARRSLVHGFGVNDADYQIVPVVDGKRVECPFYKRWASMLKRAYSSAFHFKHPTYLGVSVSSEWRLLSNFREWMIEQDWEGKHLDKDLLIEGNKLYAPDRCVFVDSMTNNFLKDFSSKGLYMVGAYPHHSGKSFRSVCRNPFSKRAEHLGMFETDMEAHKAWKARKHELALQLAEQQTDERVANALRVRFA